MHEAVGLLVDRYAPAGFTEFVVGWPATADEHERFVHLAETVVPKLR
ncbi:hypothetical protein [Jiangella rhizosphaerae]|nr:hypothetical protein [Jiangella rhizosphaerae]